LCSNIWDSQHSLQTVTWHSTVKISNGCKFSSHLGLFSFPCFHVIL
jgi:hypothetical protein